MQRQGGVNNCWWAGNLVLREVSSCLRQVLRSADQAGRYGGDEFCVLPSCTTTAEAMERLERLRQSVTTLRMDSAPLVRITLSIGMASYTDVMGDTTAWLQAADKALYAAKQRGRDCVVVAAIAVS
ncbi:GGDEF domain-containing protein [Stutzerimonas urumqiensis]|uniref:GGDEF domain-containing protein n=1 Tax=Stutzerimonas urumqiensis TaxID=638269 RepID=UPI003DA32173